jgi:hypothetical protein
MFKTLKVLYIFLAGIGVFFVNNIYVLLTIIFIHFILFGLIKNKTKNLRFLYKVKWFILIIFLFHAFTGSNDIDILKIKKWTLSLSYEGMLEGSIMTCKLISMLLITQVVRLSLKGNEFILGLKKLGLSQSSSEIIDQILAITAEEKTQGSTKKGKPGSGGGNGKGGGNRNQQNTQSNEPNSVRSIDVLLKGKIGNIPKKLLDRINFAKDKFADNPNAVIASSSLAITLIRMVKIAPGLPLAPGHKNILFFPVFIQGILKSEKRFAGTQVGFISGILHFTMGFGKYGPLGILEFAVVGWVFDLFLRIPINKNKLWFFMLLGGVGGLVRISTEMLLALVLGMPDAFFLIYLPYIISQILFGIASGFITKSIINTTEE